LNITCRRTQQGRGSKFPTAQWIEPIQAISTKIATGPVPDFAFRPQTVPSRDLYGQPPRNRAAEKSDSTVSQDTTYIYCREMEYKPTIFTHVIGVCLYTFTVWQERLTSQGAGPDSFYICRGLPRRVPVHGDRARADGMQRLQEFILSIVLKHPPLV
jgi:hypothetical protein